MPPPLRKLSQGKLNDGTGKSVPALKKASSDKKLKVRDYVVNILHLVVESYIVHPVLKLQPKSKLFPFVHVEGSMK